MIIERMEVGLTMFIKDKNKKVLILVVLCMAFCFSKKYEATDLFLPSYGQSQKIEVVKIKIPTQAAGNL